VALTVRVSIAMVVPKLLAFRVTEPVLKLPHPVRLICHEAPLADLLADLSLHKLDVVLTDSPVNPTFRVRACNHVLGESGVSFFAVPAQARALAPKFPTSPNNARMLMPSAASSIQPSPR
jgi:LysR family transcriptional activator of nhaA